MRVVEVSNIFSCCEVEFEGGLVEGRAQQQDYKRSCYALACLAPLSVSSRTPCRHCEDKMVDWWSQWLLGIHQRSIAAEQEWRKM